MSITFIGRIQSVGHYRRIYSVIEGERDWAVIEKLNGQFYK